MALPVISGTSPASPVVFNPGQMRDILVNASDADMNAPPVTQVFRVTDSAGAQVSVNVTLQLTDSLTYSSDPPPAGWTIVQDAVNRALFHVTAPV